MKVQITMENGGVMTLELYPEIAPITVDNFVKLVKDGFYNGLIFHRVIEGFMIQGGDPTGTGMGDNQRRVYGKRCKEHLETHKRRYFYGTQHEPQLCRQPVLYYAQGCSSS